MLVLTRRFAARDRPGEEVWIDGGRVKIRADRIWMEYSAGFYINGLPFVCGEGEVIPLADYTTMTIVRIYPWGVKLGFDAPKEITIDREEIHHLKNETRWKPNELMPKGEEGSQRDKQWRRRTVGDHASCDVPEMRP